MDFSPQNFVSVNEILADVLKLVKDSSFRTNTKGWYTSQIQQALSELAYDTFFQKRVELLPIPSNLRIEMPKGAFNLKEIFLTNGTKCDLGPSTPQVWHKTNFWTGGAGYAAKDKWNNGKDPFYTNRSGNPGPHGSILSSDRQISDQLYFYGLQNGLIMLSPSCRAFKNIFIYFNGTGCDIGDAPVIPEHLRQAVKDWVLVKALPNKMSDSIGTNAYNHWAFMFNSTKADLMKPFEGTWAKAEQRVKHLNKNHRQALKEYAAKMNY